MAFKKKFDGTVDEAIQLGDKNKPNERPSIEGYFMGSKDTPDSGYGPGKLHIFQTEKGTVGVWGKTNSNRLLTSDIIGQMVRLTFTGMGEKKKGKNPAYLYSVEHDSSNTIEMDGVSVNQAEMAADEPDYEEADVESEEPPVDEVPVARASAPRRAATTPDAARQAKVQALLNSASARK